jgi:hypothetical protein
MKRAVKEYTLGMSDVLKNESSSSKKLHGNEFMPELKRYSKDEKFLSRLFKSKSKDVMYNFLLLSLSFDDIENKNIVSKIAEPIFKITDS